MGLMNTRWRVIPCYALGVNRLPLVLSLMEIRVTYGERFPDGYLYEVSGMGYIRPASRECWAELGDVVSFTDEETLEACLVRLESIGLWIQLAHLPRVHEETYEDDDGYSRPVCRATG